MKKMLIVLMLGFTTLIYSEGFSLGAYSGLSLLVEDTSDVEELYDAQVSKLGVPVMVEVLYQLNNKFEIPSLGECTLDVGGKGGFLTLSTVEYSLLGSDLKMNMYTVPLLAYGRATAGNFYLGLGLGFHAWFIDSYLNGEKLDLGTMNGIDFCAVLEPGYRFPINEKLAILGGISIYNAGYELEDDDVTTSNSFALNIGVNYHL